MELHEESVHRKWMSGILKSHRKKRDVTLKGKAEQASLQLHPVLEREELAAAIQRVELGSPIRGGLVGRSRLSSYLQSPKMVHIKHSEEV